MTSRAFLRLCCVGLALCCAACGKPAPAPKASPGAKDPYDAFRAALAADAQDIAGKRGMAGLSVAVVDEDRLVYAEGFGYADAARTQKATAETVYRTGSFAKPVTVAALMRLVEAGQIDLDQPYRGYVPDFRIQSRFPEGTDFTIRQIMTHHAGLPANLMHEQFRIEPTPQTRLLEALPAEYMAAPPGTVYAYSNVGYGLLGHMIATLTEDPFEAYMREAFFAPVGMTTADFERSAAIDALVAEGVHRGEAMHQSVNRDRAADNLYASVKDMAAFMQIMLTEGKVKGESFLKPESVAEIFRVQNADVPYDNGFATGLAWALTWDELDYLGRVAWQTGSDLNYHGAMILALDHGLGVVVLGNSSTAIRYVRHFARQALMDAVEAKTGLAPPEAPEKKPTLKTPAALLDSAPGYYTSYLGSMKVYRHGERLWVEGYGHTADLVPEPKNRFSFRYRLLGVVPVSPLLLESVGISAATDYSVEFFDAGNRQMIMYRENPRVTRGQRVEPVPIPEAWRQRLGHYAVANRGDDREALKFVELSIKDGFLFMAVKVSFISAVWVTPILLPLSDEEALIAGLGRRQGDTVFAYEEDGTTHIRYSGYIFTPSEKD